MLSLLAVDTRSILAVQVIYFSLPATRRLVEVAHTYPLDCCTYMGLDMDRRPLRIELYRWGIKDLLGRHLLYH
jgi:hypothetical protein